MSGNIKERLRHLEFPQCTRAALDHLVRCYADTGGGIPGLGGGTENLVDEVVQDYILNLSRKRPGQRNLTAVQELQLLELLCSCLQDAPEMFCYSIFSVIFGGQVDSHKTGLLTKLVSLAISVGCGAVLGCAALWMQELGSQSQAVCDLAQKLVDDYCLLFPNVSMNFQRLPSVSPLFTCNFITAVTTIYTMLDKSRIPPVGLVEYITEWVSSDPCLCSESVRLIRIRSNFTCPLYGLVRWCVIGPLLCKDQYPSGAELESHDKMLSLLSKLHISVLLSLQAYKSMELNQELFMFGDIYLLAKIIATHYKNGNFKCDEESQLQVSLDRLGQTIQVAMITGSLNGNSI
ncbi:hypothetical protein ACJMK2_034708 [Sinanodonta woodiana]|uniref:Uncharacterized protein n=1 Tax=Sinanodonta woodiana TaxID=1069815 RepID=A0ABD3WWB4_SINWO